jgi:hypothetical protein
MMNEENNQVISLKEDIVTMKEEIIKLNNLILELMKELKINMSIKKESKNSDEIDEILKTCLDNF